MTGGAMRDERPEYVLGIGPAGQSCAGLCAAVAAVGGLGVLDLGTGGRRARSALARTARAAKAVDRRFGLRVPEGCALSFAEVAEILGAAAERVDVVVLGWDSPWRVSDVPDRYVVLVEVTSPAEAVAASEQGADGLLARGAESGGRVSETGAFVLLQQIIDASPLPVWLAGGIGPDTAAAAVVGGAAGVVLDTQLALLAETDIPDDLAAAIAASDGTDTTVVTGHRVLPGGAPVGQDAFLATEFRRRFGTVARAVRAVLTAIGAAVHATRPPVLGPGSALAEALGTRYPIAQGPMTRVSDRAEFADAVAAGGALPFLALALNSGERSREMLSATRALLGERPWGVGLLGFAPPELRAAQVEAVLAARPPAALIAGGRPDQAAVLEAAGIATFLHVPSPGLLRQFLDAGARRFVFEGSECGGHVGPRTSFALWQAQLDVLREHPGGGEVQVLFAGGVHDARSAAMVAALAGPLADRGAAIGVLMGTAYLFTEEAVAGGAITDTFQQQVIAASGTELLHTAPGHATRCVASPFTGFFAETAARLKAAGVPEREAWAKLEELNVGRLRVASKGLRREGDALVEVDAEGRVADGMFMAGQVAALRSTVTTIDDLHRAVSVGAGEHLRERAARVRDDLPRTRPPRPAPEPADIAVVGMACVYPGAPDLAAFWANIVGNRDSVTEVPPTRWDPEVYFGDGQGKTRSKWGGFLDAVPFDPLRYGIPPAALGSIEPVQLLALEIAQRALEDAGYGQGGFDRERAGVVFGAEAGGDLSKAEDLRMFLPSYASSVPDELMAQLPELTGDSFPGRLANVIAGRVANRLDLGGTNYVVDAACGSSLAAVESACKELETGSADLMLAGGADLHNAIGDYLLFSSVGALSPTGRCRTFDSSADGIALGEGVACVVLKRLADAEHDGDRIYAVIKGMGAGSDGRALGLTAPRPEGQRRAVERAYAKAGVSPVDIGMVEAHGTGTVVGDRTELTTLTEVFGAAGAAPGSVGLGSVKSQIGHTKCAAGIAGLIKAAMAVHTGVRPPTLHVAEPNPAWDPATSPFAFRSSAAPWPGEPSARVAAVSAFGFGGTNFHAVLSGHTRARRGLTRWPAELFVFRGASEDAALAAVRSLLALADGPVALRDLARTAAVRADRDPAPVRVAVVARDVAELAGLLRRALAGETDPEAGLYRASGAERGKLAVLFPGQGSQRPGMLAELFVAVPDLLPAADPDVLSALFPPDAFSDDAAKAAADRLRDTRMAQPALGVTGLAVHEVLTRLGVQPDMYGGHSYGELVALAAAGAIDPGDLLPLSAARAAAILAAAGDDPGAMAAVGADYARVQSVLADAMLAGRVVVANHNAPSQVVLSGPTALVAEAVEALRAAGVSARPLPVACAFHSPVVAAAAEAFADELALHRVEPPRVPVWANRTARPYVSDVDGIRAELAAQVASPVLFAAQIENMYADGARVFFEAGPGRVLSNLVRSTLGDRPHTVVSCEPGKRTGLSGLLHALATLAVTGVPLRTGWLTTGRDAVELTGPVAAAPGWTVDGHLVRTADGTPVAGGLSPARRVAAFAPTPAQPVDRDTMVSDFLRSTRELVAAQRDVLLGYLGAPPPAAPTPTAPAPAPALTAPTPLPPAPAPTTSTAPSVAATITAVIAERTGYPAEMVEPDLDLEADLSIDSIKRTEIVGELVSRLGTAVSVDELVRARTAAELTRLLDGRPSKPVSSVAETIVAVIAERTGYPVEMVEPSLDLEADLSIDSIKRTEIVGELVSRLGSAVSVDELVQARTAAELTRLLDGQPSKSVSSVAETIVAVIAERTGYPAEMVEPDLDLEADLSIDSIKRTEIVGELATRLKTTVPIDELVSARTAAQLATLLGDTAPPPRQEPARGAQAGRSAPAGGDRSTDGVVPTRRELVAVAAPANPNDDPGALFGATILILGGTPSSIEAVAGRLSAHGGLAVPLPSAAELPEWVERVDGLVCLPSDGPLLPGGFGLVRSVLARRPRWLVAVEEEGRALGLAGFMRTVRKEHPETAARVVELAAPVPDDEALVDIVIDELLATGTEPVVVRGDERRAYVLKDRPLTGSGDLGLGPDSVVLLIGGARGITARVAAGLTGARCTLELAGRTSPPTEPEDAETAAAQDLPALRGVLARRGGTPAEADRAARAILARREVAATLAELRAKGATAVHRKVDAGDAHAVRRLVKQVHAEHGRIDGVVYAAGVIEDRLIADKDPESFRRVYATKVDGMAALLGGLDDAAVAPRFVVAFGSIAAVLGNRGQADYAAANSAVDTLTAQWSRRTGHRALTVHWGPWAPSAGGMVTPELSRVYAERGIELIDPDAGVAALLAEIASGTAHSVLYAGEGW
ncbi:type I polyketide synthase [Actinokineospora fastidiosa]|nr:type I polyketide synthase [Actinokineospora fastidiosa]